MSSLCRKEYSDSVAWGFVDLESDGDSIRGTFVERFESDQEVVHPLGQILRFKRVDFSRITFSLAVAQPRLEIIDSPRSIEPLLTELSQTCNQLVFSKIDLDVNALVRFVKRKTRSCTMISATLRDVPLSAGVIASVEVRGSSEIQRHLEMAAFGTRPVLERALLIGTIDNDAFRFQISADARIHVVAREPEALCDIIREFIRESLG